ncbi:putative phage infection (PIP) family protein YhgE [Peribacillus cavernae]|nr:putative phage infection (PIP) family protein YhgE [Peribacillus cavernae]
MIMTKTDVLEDEIIAYSEELIKVIEKEETLIQYPKVKEQLNLLKEAIVDDMEQLQCSKDLDIRRPTLPFLDT